MSLPIVAIVGRPNVGKSSLLNALVGKRISIVDATPGVTRDRVSSPCPIAIGAEERYIELVDTGGMGIEDVDKLTDHVEAQIAFAVNSASLILFIVDAREGLTALDRHVAQELRKQNTPVLLLANKIDQVNLTTELAEMNGLGFGEPLPISAAHQQGVTDLMAAIARTIGSMAMEAIPQPVMKLAVVGKRNAGKSTFINALAGQERVIVSEVPGTTRDSVDVSIEIDGRQFMVIDTAGLRKRKSLAGDIEFYSYRRAVRSVGRADVVALMIDASVKISQVDKDISGLVAEQFKPVVIIVNKWDLARGKAAAEDYDEYLNKVLPELSYAPISMTTAVTGENVRRTVQLAEQLFAQANTRMSTAKLNEVVKEITTLRGPSHKSGTKPPKILYASQIDVAPPTIVCFVNDVRSFDDNYQRFLLARLRETTPFSEVPVRLLFRQRRGREEEKQS
ncbi:MAG: ribosome biogenesis GTPase Der [Planctomycetaceae bacterium]|nr:ribosome biogenesis GTPase Der [Planctomycetaceae bacterium]